MYLTFILPALTHIFLSVIFYNIPKVSQFQNLFLLKVVYLVQIMLVDTFTNPVENLESKCVSGCPTSATCHRS